MTRDQARAAAQAAVLTGEFDIARQLAAGLLQADPADRAALIVLAAVEPRLGRPAQGRMAGARAYAASSTSRQKYEAARLTALAAANEDRFTLSQFWLRRAATVAPTPQDYEQNQADYRGLRALNPWQTDVQLSFAPSNNVNGGSADLYNIIDGLPFVGILSGSAQALPGLTASADLRVSYQLDRTAVSQTTLTGRLYDRGVWLSSEARALSPTSTNGDFASALAEGEVRHVRALKNGQIAGAFALGRSWYGGEVNYTYVRASVDRNLALSDTLRARFGSQIEQRFDLNQPADMARALDASLAWTLPGGAQMSGSLGWDGTQSANANARSDIYTAQISFAPAQPMGPAQVRATLGASFADYPDYAFPFAVPGGRQDRSVFGSFEMAFPDYGYAGFAPVVTLGALRADSNVSRFNRSEVSLRFGLRSTF